MRDFTTFSDEALQAFVTNLAVTPRTSERRRLYQHANFELSYRAAERAEFKKSVQVEVNELPELVEARNTRVA